MEPYHSVPNLIQKFHFVIVNSWSVLNIEATWFDFFVIKYSVYKVSTSLKSCWRFHTFSILIIYYFNMATAIFPLKIIKFLLQQSNREYCTRLSLYSPPLLVLYCLISLAAFKVYLRGIRVFITQIHTFLLSLNKKSAQRNPISVISELNF